MKHQPALLLAVAVVAASLGLGCRREAPLPIRTLSGFPFDPARANQNDFTPTGALEQLSSHLYRYRDSCNVYIVRRGERALLVDFGTGDVLHVLPRTGVTGIDRVLITHHHRDQVQGLADLGHYQFRVAAPQGEADLLDNVEAFWRTAPIYLNYDLRSRWNSLRRSIRVDEKVSGGDTIRWKGLTFRVLDTPGHTEHSVSYSTVIDGRRVVFTGDLLAGVGKVHDWWDLHWRYYGFTDGIDASENSFARVRAEKPAWLLPSHGDPIRHPEAAMRANSRIYAELRRLLPPNELHRENGRMRAILPHLVFVGGPPSERPGSLTSYAIVSRSGKALLYDCGYVQMEQLEKLKRKFGIRYVDVVTFSHYHDDHIIRTYELWRNHRTRIWVAEDMVDIFEHPRRYRLPCLIPFPIHADRVLHDGEKVRWEEYTLEFFHLPGQTEYHQGLFTVIDGQRVLFTGDDTWKKAHPEQVRNGPIVPQNIYFLDGGFITCARQMLHYRPDIVCPAHTHEYSPTRPDLEQFLGWAKRVRKVMTELILQPDPNFGMDYQWCHFYPYRVVSQPGRPFRIELRIRNHLFRTAHVTLRLKHSGNIRCPQPVRRFTIEAKTQVAVPFVVEKIGRFGRREVITADVTIDGHRFGELAEMLVD